MKKRTIGKILQIPAWLLMLAWLAGSTYMAATKQLGINWGVPIILAVIVGLYFWGRALESKN